MRAIAVGAFWLSMTLTAAAAPPAEIFRAFGLLGTWAVDCGQPASPQNPYVRDFVENTGAVVEEHHLGPDYAVNHYGVSSAHQLSATEVELEVVFQPGNKAVLRQKLVMRVANGRRRTLFNQPAGGKVRVENGVVLNVGLKTPTLTKCR